MFRKLTADDKVVVSIVAPNLKIETGKIVNVTKNLLTVRAEPPNLPRWSEFNRVTGFNVRGEEFGKLLQDYDLAIKEAPEIVCPYCGVPQKNFFMACEFLQGGKNFKCYRCEKVLWLGIHGNVKKLLPVECES